MIQNPKKIPNPFQSDDWFSEVVKQDENIQRLQKQEFLKFTKKYYPTVTSLNPFQQNWLALSKLFTTNLVFSSSLVVFLLCTIGVSATQIIAPDQYKPSVLLFGKGQYQIKNSTISVSSSSSSEVSSSSSEIESSSSSQSSFSSSSESSKSSEIASQKINSIPNSETSSEQIYLELRPSNYRSSSSSQDSSAVLKDEIKLVPVGLDDQNSSAAWSSSSTSVSSNTENNLPQLQK